MSVKLEVSFQTDLIEAGCDEAGRGCLAGPVVAAAVILPGDFYHPLLDDSKKMSSRNREMLQDIIKKEAVAWSVAMVDAARIDEINILQASFEAMSLAAANLSVIPQLLSIDGNRFVPSSAIPYNCFIKGDGKYANIAAASVLAKTARDEYMRQIGQEYPEYGWDANKGYPTRSHRLAILKYGLSPFHRLSFSHSAGQLSLFSDLNSLSF